MLELDQQPRASDIGNNNHQQWFSPPKGIYVHTSSREEATVSTSAVVSEGMEGGEGKVPASADLSQI